MSPRNMFLGAMGHVALRLQHEEDVHPLPEVVQPRQPGVLTRLPRSKDK